MQDTRFQKWADRNFEDGKFPELPDSVAEQSIFLGELSEFLSGLDENKLIQVIGALPSKLGDRIDTVRITIAMDNASRAASGIRCKILIGELAVDFLLHDDNFPDCLYRIDSLIKLARKLDDTEELSILYNYKGVCNYRLAEYSQARTDLLESLKFADEIDSDRRRARARINLGLVMQEVGLLEEAASHYKAALKLARDIDDSRTVLSCYLNIGYIYLELKRWADSKNAIEKGIDLAEELGEDKEALRGRLNLGVLYMEQGEKPDHPTEIFRDVLAGAEKSGAVEIWELSYLNLATSLLRASKYSESIEISKKSLENSGVRENPENRWRVYENLAMAYWKMGKVGEAEDAFRQALGVFDELRRGLETRRERMEYLRNLKGLQNEYISFSIENYSMETAYARLAAAKMISIFDEEKSTVTSGAANETEIIAKIQSELKSKPGTVLLDYLLYNNTMKVFALTDDSVEIRDIDGSPGDIADLLKEIHDTISLFIASGTYRETRINEEISPPEPYLKLGKILLDPVADVLKGKKHILIVPTGILHSVPFNALSTDGQRYLIEDYTISLLPSGLFGVTGAEIASDGRSLLILRGDETDLSGIETEVEAINAAWSGKAVIKSAHGIFRDKGIEGMLDEMAGYNLVYFTGHASYDPVDPYLSALHLGDEKYIRIIDLLCYPVTFDKTYSVVLAACETGAGRASAGDEVVGLAHAFLSLGVRSVLMSQWKVSDEMTSRIMPKLFESIAGNVPLSASLKSAILSSGRIHPYFFAPFHIIGVEPD